MRNIAHKIIVLGLTTSDSRASCEQKKKKLKELKAKLFLKDPTVKATLRCCLHV